MKKMLIIGIVLMSTSALSAQTKYNFRFGGAFSLSSASADIHSVDYSGTTLGGEFGLEYMITPSWGAGIAHARRVAFYTQDNNTALDLDAFSIKGYLLTTSYTLFPESFFKVYGVMAAGVYQTTRPEISISSTVQGQRITIKRPEEKAISLGVAPEIGILLGGFRLGYSLGVISEGELETSKEKISQTIHHFKLGFFYDFGF